MKLTKKLEVEVLKFYKSYWDAYLSGDMKTFASMLDDELTVFGTAVSEVFNNKKEAVKFYHATADQLVGKAQFRNSKFKLQVVDDAVLINQQCDFYILLEKKWTFYGHARVTAILKHTKSGWKLVHQHASFPDVRAEEGEQVAANKIKEENIQLRDAVKRRTIELEEKNRELEIEAALERVGTVAMSMKKPGDLLSVCKTGFKELKKLGFTDLRNMIIHTYVDDQKYFNDYDYSDALGGAISRVPYTGNPIIENFIRTIRKGTSAFSEIKITGKQLDDWKKFRKANKEANDPRLNKSKALYYYNYSVGSGSIGISTFNPVDDEKRNVLVRFRNVFDLSYRRYLDIEKAEAQAREAQIQLALERVRAKSLAMHHSSELQEVVNIAAAQLHRIGMDINGGVFICINAEVDKELPVWASGGAADYVHKAIVPFLNKPIFTRIRNAIKKGNSFLIESFSDREKRELFRHLFKHEPWRSLPQERKQELLSRKGGFARSVVISKHTSISITNHFGKSFTEEENEILKRFGKVFEQSYIRFLDLQKAEAQAREAQIEVAVERVRAKALAMHRSDEIHEVVRTLRNELFGLELEGITGATICLRQSDGQVRLWDITDVDKTGRYGWDILFDMSEIDPRLWVKRIWNARKKIIAVEQDSNDLKRALQWLGHYNKKTAADITKLLKRNKINHGWHCAVQLANGILITDFVNESPAEIEPILLKTGAAFDLAYKRFLDLQKAEAQAREAQIEAALERVRAKSMGMRFSSELGEVIKEVTDQLYLLGFNFDTSNIGTQYDKNGFYLWNSSPEEPVLSSIYVPAKKLKIVDWFYGQKKWVAQVRSFLFGKRDTNNFFKYYLSTKDGSRIPGIRKTFLISVPSISVITAFRKDFTLSVLNYRGVKYSDEDAAILNRFANVFEQSYTRFLDLQKAESQAREAQIEVAVERVRAKALAMHKSEDLHSVVVTLKKELRGLQIPDVTAATIYLQQDDGLIRILDLSGADKADDEQVEFKMDKVFRIEDIHPKLWINRMWKRKENYFVEEADKADFDRIIDWLYTIDKSEASIAEKIIREKKIERAWLPTVKLEKGVMNIDLLQPPAPEIETILLKIGAGFDLAYKRFLDLQKAEAQAREAQIEAALEKVRSRSLAMHKSDELKEVVAVLYQKLQELDFDMDKGAAIMITYSSDSKDITQWITDATQTYAVPFFIPFTGYAIPLDQDNARKKNLPFFSRIYDRKEKNEYFRYLFKHTQYSQLPEPVQQMILDSKNFGISIALEKNSAIAIPSTIGKLVTGDEITILKRFSNVFEQCYTRFLDLQKAEAQAREAQIQLALERVRARTMAMHRSDELTDVVKLLYQEFDKLKLSNESTDIEIGLINEETGMAAVWAHLYLSDGTISTFDFPIGHFEGTIAEFKKWKSTPVEKRNELFFTSEFKGKFWNKFKKWIKKFPELAEAFQPMIEANITQWVTHNAYFSHGILTLQGIETYSPETLDIQKRFTKVFEQTYTRFLDLRKAEAQAKEAEIELALERIRARTMAMHASEELLDIIVVVSEQLQQLEIKFGNVSFGVNNPDYDLQLWMAVKGYPKAYPIQWTFIDNPGITRLKEAQRNPEEVFADVLSQAENNEWMLHVFKCNPPFDIFSDENRDRLLNTPGYARSIVIMKDIFLVIGNYAAIPYTDEENAIFKRFGNVFEQSYTRFLDLQKAEVQAREAQIEAALERVRASSMAMHQSKDLLAVIKVVTDQLLFLGFKFDTANFAKVYADGSWDLWLTTPEQKYPDLIHVPYLDHPIFNRIEDNIAKGLDFFTDAYEKNEANKFFRHFFENTIAKNAPESRKQFVLNSPGFARSLFSMKDLWLAIANYEGMPYTDAENLVFKRFAKVFEQAYTRFLDLQKAEAQAREAQIELGLERVRARAMAMHRSEELKELIATMSSELGRLDILLDRCFIIIYDQHTQGSTWWMANPETPTEPIGLQVQYHEHVPYLEHLEAWRQRKVKWEYILEGKVKKEWDQFLFVETELSQLPPPVIENMRSKKKVYLSSSFNNFGYLTLATLDPLTEQQFDIMLRFAKVFDLTYTRFNDLKQAEAQARESQIQLALERVRARTMAMQKAQELDAVIKTVYAELKQLDVSFDRCFIMIFDEKKGATWWMGSPEDDLFHEGFYVQYHAHPPHLAYLKGWEERQQKWEYWLGGQIKKDWDEFIFNKTGLSKLPSVAIEYMKSFESANLSAAFENFGCITTGGQERISEESYNILGRFAKVFDLTYTRFLDLQKAEAQAREAQIQLALERVRARAMAMQDPAEFVEVVNVMGKQFIYLGFDIEWANFGANGLDITNGIDTWNFAIIPGSDPVSSRLFIPWFDHPLFNDAKKQLDNYLDNGNDLFVMSYDKETKDRWLDHMFAQTIFKDVPDEYRAIQYEKPGYTTSNLALKDTWLSIGKFNTHSFTDEQHGILRRMGNAFGQAYTRFLDLQRAEAQARESQIQLALERVRARTMAMQRSDELPQAANLLFQQIQSLGMPTWSAGYCIWDDDKKAITLWMSSEGVIQPSLRMPLTEDPSLIHFLEAYQRGESFFAEEVGGEALRTHYAYLRTLPGVKETLDDIEKAGFPVPTFQIFHLAYFSKGFLLFITYQPVPEAHDIFKRFGKVFDQTYTRFLDLQRAEAQAKEARVEISLERIRARALAMHSSDELMEVAKVLREQMALLGQRELESSVVHLYKLDPDHIHSWRAVSIAAESRSGFTYGHMAIPVNCCEVVREWLGKFNSDEQEYTLEISGAKQQEWYLILEKLAPEVVNSMRSENSLHEKRYYRFSKFSGGALLMISKQPPSEEAAYLQKRASVVFDLAYRRFSDLQKAEAQAREAQIEAALEKIRSRSLAMHQSEELQEVVNTVFERLNDLNIEIDSCNIAIFKERTKDWEYWIASPSQKRSAVFYMPYIDFGVTKDLVEAKEKGADFFTRSYRYEEKNEWFEYGFKNTDFKYLSEQRQKYILDAPAMTVGIAFAKYTGVQFNRYSFNKLTEGEIDILKRFAKVFEQAYIRFLDLQKAEAQAREAQIEAALERVRAKAMAMHKSDDLHAAVTIMFEEFQKLNLDVLRCGVGILDKNSRTGEIWATSISDSGIAVQISASESFDTHPLMSLIYESWQKQQDLDYVLQGQDLIDYYRAMKLSELKLPESQFALSEDDLQPQYYYGAMFKAGGLYSFRNKPFTDEDIKIMRRFASVVNLTYNRFIDLQKAEASAREAQIEAGLERVRARTMAMHSSEDVSAATATMFTELEKLGIENYRGGITNIFPDRTQEVWSVNNLAEGKSVKAVGRFNIDDHPFWQLMFHDWETKKDFTHYFLADDDKEEYIKVLNMTQGYLPQAFQQFPNVHFQVYYFNEGAVWTNSLHRHTDEEQQIMKRFASVFSLTFRRYQDLKKAEAQAKEATIEAALERVRGKAMAMHSSKDLATTIGVFYHELEGLNLTPRRCGVGLINKETWTAEISTMNATVDGQSVELVGVLDMRSHPILTGVYNNWLTKTEYHPVLRGNEIKEYYQLLRPQVAFPDYPADTAQYGYFFFFDEGGVYAWTEKELQEDELKIYRRFTSVLSLTYKRYKDLKDAELRAQNAVKEAALDRIRADIASMRTVEDLDRITPLIWNELKTLKVPFIRCGVFIMDDSQQFIHTFLSTPDGKAIAAFHLPYDTPGNIGLVISNWRDKKKYIDHWKETEFRQFAEILVQQGALSSAGNYLKTIPHGGFFLHFLPFLQGMLYVGNTEKLNSEEIELIQHVADAFSTAYARYEDFNRLEAAKQQVDKTLVDLKQAQQQLVQSEKMASLGELTAGIAHEIQNPLNFVNNFSDVSNELLEEMKGELVTGNTQSAMEIVEDIKQNLEKILHHGKRADAIVKGMLQHSRTSSGQKEMTDINMLADEYLRLAYHGLRAKDKSFNAKFETHFDSNIGKVNVIPQDIGRVILNLINNAFYAVSEKQKYSGNARPDDPRLNDSVGQAGGRGYEPTVTVTTLKDNGRIEIKVKDNGNGIPQKNLDKIFQPFFTTKPTGQGTGLGLSLAYDIITKGHGGELKVETKEGEGTEFVISL